MRALMIREDVPPSELRRLAKTEDNLRVARRLLAIAAALEGMSREAAARIADRQRRLAHRERPAGAAEHYPRPPAALLARAERHREGLVVSARPLPVGPAVPRHAGHRRRLLRGMEPLRKPTTRHHLDRIETLGEGQSVEPLG